MNGAAALIWRSRLRRRWRAWVALALLLGLGTGTGLACLAGARRTASAFDRFAAATGFADVNSSHGLPPAESEVLAAGVTGVAGYATVVGFTGFVEDLDPTLFQDFVGLTGDNFAAGRPLLRQGRYPRSDRADEVLLTSEGDRRQWHQAG